MNKILTKWEAQVVDVLKENSTTWDYQEDCYSIDIVRVLSALPSLNKMSCRSFCFVFAQEKKRVKAGTLITDLMQIGEVKIIFQPPLETEYPLFILLKGEYFILIKDYLRARLKTYKIG